mmetsp:Transcript_11099/g.21474  ORF Transcript_11099/g.21474 Transcript_11099/m.21474 type:complete len:205 (-) Transcript_11099:63-677(-)
MLSSAVSRLASASSKSCFVTLLSSSSSPSSPGSSCGLSLTSSSPQIHSLQAHFSSPNSFSLLMLIFLFFTRSPSRLTDSARSSRFVMKKTARQSLTKSRGSSDRLKRIGAVQRMILRMNPFTMMLMTIRIVASVLQLREQPQPRNLGLCCIFEFLLRNSCIQNLKSNPLPISSPLFTPTNKTEISHLNPELFSQPPLLLLSEYM